MSHDHGRRATCGKTIRIRWLHFESPSIARGVTDMVVGSGALLGLLIRIMMFEDCTEEIVAKRFAWLSPERIRSQSKPFLDRCIRSQASRIETREAQLSYASHAQRQR